MRDPEAVSEMARKILAGEWTMKKFGAHGAPEDPLKKRMRAKLSPKARKKPHEMSDSELDDAVFDTGLLVEERIEVLCEMKTRVMKKGVEVGLGMERDRVEKEAEEAEQAVHLEKMKRARDTEGSGG